MISDEDLELTKLEIEERSPVFIQSTHGPDRDLELQVGGILPTKTHWVREYPHFAHGGFGVLHLERDRDAGDRVRQVRVVKVLLQEDLNQGWRAELKALVEFSWFEVKPYSRTTSVPELDPLTPSVALQLALLCRLPWLV
jgi:hypothetical protein